MKKIYTLVGVLLLCLFSTAQSTSYISSSPFKITAQSDENILLQFTLPEWSLKNTDAKGLKNAAIVDVANSGVTLEEGHPELPLYSASLSANLTEPIVTIINKEYTDFNDVVIAPSPGMGERDKDNRKRKAFDEVYEMDAFYPKDILSSVQSFSFRSASGISLAVVPFQYNPVKKILRVYHSLEVKVEGEQSIKSTVANSGRDFERLYNRLVLNPEPVEAKGYTAPQMLVLSPEGFHDALKPYLSWKNQKGINAVWANSDKFGSTEEIYNYVKSQYFDNGLMFLVLVGDADIIPTFTVENGYSDMMYGYVEGDDHFPDVFVGRISADNATDVRFQVERFLAYEKTPYTGKDWFSRAVGIASKGGPGHNDEMDYDHIRNLQSRLSEYTYRETPEYFDGSQGGSDASGDVLTEDIIDAINTGAGAVFYAGHADEQRWFTSAFGTEYVEELNNTGMLPLVFSVACHAGNFVDNDCFAEALLTGRNYDENVGAAGAFMSTGSISWVAPMHAQDAMADIIASGAESMSFGAIAAGGCMAMNEIYFWAGDKVTDTWVLFGDPSLEFRSTYPAALEVEHPDQIASMAQYIPVKAIADYALATLSDEGKLIASVELNGEQGYIPVNGTLKKNHTYDLVVTGSNRMPYIATISTSDAAGQATTPSPSDHANMISVLPQLQWACNGSCENVQWNIYVGTNNPPSNIVNGVTVDELKHVVSSVLQQNTTYYWRVDALYNNEVSEGEVWSFTTLAEPDEDFEHFYDKSAPLLGGNPAWSVEKGNPFRGEYSAHTTAVEPGQSCIMELNCTLESDDFVGFWLKMSDEPGDGILEFLVNDEKVLSWDAEEPWQWVEHPLASGTCNLKWKYSRVSGSRGIMEGAWIDDVFIPGNRAVYAFAGYDITVCLDDKPVIEAAAEAWTRLYWQTDGDGGFDDNTLVNPRYYPGPLDLSRGSVTLNLTVLNDKTATEMRDQVIIYFSRPPEVKIKVSTQ